MSWHRSRVLGMQGRTLAALTLALVLVAEADVSPSVLPLVLWSARVARSPASSPLDFPAGNSGAREEAHRNDRKKTGLAAVLYRGTDCTSCYVAVMVVCGRASTSLAWRRARSRMAKQFK